MVRKLAAALLGAGVMIPGLVQALGLGGIKLHSALSEPLNAEIELVQVRGVGADEILAALAASSEFQARGIERFHYLNDLRFQVQVNPNGRSFIKVTSRKAITEPGLDFLVDVHWPDGRLVREYSVLLDPPTYRPQPAPRIQPATASRAPTQSAAPASSAVGQRGASSPAPSRSSQEAPPANFGALGGYGPTGPADSLWEIATQLRPSERATIQQTMLAIQQLNPNAFLNNNINLLKKGQVLRAPSESDALTISAKDAIQRVTEQNQAWRNRGASGAQAAPVDTTGKGGGVVPTRVEGEDGKLTLLAPARTEAASQESAQGGTAKAESGGGVLRDKLALAEENADKARLENTDLKQRISDLQEQAKTSEQLIQLKNDQLAALQKQVEELQALAQSKSPDTSHAKQPSDQAASTPNAAEEPTATAPETPVTTPAPEAATDAATSLVEPAKVEAVEPESAPSEPAKAAEPDASATAEPAATENLAPPAKGEGTNDIPADHPVIGEVESPALVTPESASQTASLAETTPVAKENKPAATQQASAEPATLAEEVLSNWVYLMGALGLGIIGISVIAMRRRKEEEALAEMDDTLAESFRLPDTARKLAPAAIPEEPEALDEVVALESEAPSEAPPAKDVLEEAEVYIAYGRLNQATDLLQAAAEKQPARDDIRLKLLEIAVESKNLALFEKHAAAIRSNGKAGSIARMDSLYQSLGLAAASVAPAVPPAVSLAQEPAAKGLDTDHTDHGDLHDLEFEAPDLDFQSSDLVEPATSTARDEKSSGLDFSLDFEPSGLSRSGELSRSESAKTGVASPQAAAQDDHSLDFDLEMDLDKEFGHLEDAPEPPVAEKVAEIPSLDFEEAESSDVRHAMDFESEATIDSSSAALLANELDFDAPSEPRAESAGLGELDFAPSEEQPPHEASSIEGLSIEELSIEEPSHEALAFDELALDEHEPVEFSLDAPVANEAAKPAPVAESPSKFVATPEVAAEMGASFPGAALTDEDLDFIAGGDEAATKLDLARAYLDMGDRDGARDILDEVAQTGNADQKKEAQALLAHLD
ncbi:Hypothetical protein HDN1F_16230 [gamma proteobacterium HdN1]|nr:Hypothetical protein HDN1F_16230 [gamma proteobacterium HdN1]